MTKRGNFGPPRVLILIDGEDLDGAWNNVLQMLSRKGLKTNLHCGSNAYKFGQVPDLGREPLFVVAHGRLAVGIACRAKVTQAIVMVECVPHGDCAIPKHPTLIVCGRQSTNISHKQAVAGLERLAFGRLVELEECGSRPQNEQPEALSDAILWFIRDTLTDESAHESQ